jgi:hypothetical protein
MIDGKCGSQAKVFAPQQTRKGNAVLVPATQYSRRGEARQRALPSLRDTKHGACKDGQEEWDTGTSSNFFSVLFCLFTLTSCAGGNNDTRQSLLREMYGRYSTSLKIG